MRISQQKKRIRNLSFLIVLILIISGLLFALFAEHSRRLKSLYRRNVEIMKRLNIPRTSLAGFHSPEIHNHDSQFESLQTVLSDPVFLRNSNAGIPLLSERLNLSAAETAGLVKAYSDMTINQLLNFYRTALAREMISKRGKNARIKEVMYECGYTNKSTFYYAFRQNTGLSPSEFRQQVIENGGPKSTT